MKQIFTIAAGVLIALLGYQIFINFMMESAMEKHYVSYEEAMKRNNYQPAHNKSQSQYRYVYDKYSRLKTRLGNYVNSRQKLPEYISDFACWKCNNTKRISSRLLDNHIYIYNTNNHFMSIDFELMPSGELSLGCSYNNPEWKDLNKTEKCHYSNTTDPSTFAYAVPFSCLSTQTESEHYICKSDQLLHLEEQLIEGYEAALEKATPAIKALVTSTQSRFYIEREDQCIGNVRSEQKIFKCISAQTRTQINRLN